MINVAYTVIYSAFSNVLGDMSCSGSIIWFKLLEKHVHNRFSSGLNWPFVCILSYHEEGHIADQAYNAP